MSSLKHLYNKAGGSQILRQYLKTGMWWRGSLQLLVSGFSKKSLEIFRLTANLQVYKYVKKHYWTYFDKIDFSEVEKEHQNSNKVWVCWFQGMDNAPLVVQRCYESMRKYLKNEDIILLTDENLSKYVSFPQYITDMYKSGVITKTHLTDFIRLELLTKYGGTWIDATVLCTGELPNYIVNSEVFFFRTLKPGLDGHSIGLSSWFISAKSHNKILVAVRELMYEYWRRNKTLIDYFLIHIFLQMALERFPEEEAKMVKMSNCTPHILLLDMFRPFNADLYNAMKTQTPVHKLAYKRTKEEMEREGTYYDEIIKKGNF